MHRFTCRTIFITLFLLLLEGSLPGQQVTLLGLRAVNHAGAFHGLRHDSAGNLYTLFEAQDGVRLQKYSADGTQLLGETHVGQTGDSGIALDLDSAGNVYVAGTSNSLGSLNGTSGTAFPTRSGTRTNGFVASFSPQLQVQWLTFCGAEPIAVMSVAVSGSSVLVTGSIFSSTLPVGCGSGGDPRIRYVAPGTYTFHVTATSTSGLTITQTVALNVAVTPR